MGMVVCRFLMNWGVMQVTYMDYLPQWSDMPRCYRRRWFVPGQSAGAQESELPGIVLLHKARLTRVPSLR